MIAEFSKRDKTIVNVFIKKKTAMFYCTNKKDMPILSVRALHINLTFKCFTKVEGKHAIDSPGMPKSAEVPPEEYLLEENEERSMIEPKSYDNPKLKSLIR